MAYKVIKNSDTTQPDVVEIVADTLEDLDSMSTNYGVGSDCIVLEDSSVWMLGNDKTWHQL